MLIAHGLLKVFVFTLPGTAQFFESVGFPGFLAYVVTPAEVIAGVLLVLGLQTRWVALATLPILIGAASVHTGNGWVFSAPNGGWEYPVLLIVLAALLPGFFSYQAYAYMLRELGTARSSLVMYLAPVYAAGTAWLVLGEPPRAYHAVGAALILPSIWLAARRPPVR